MTFSIIFKHEKICVDLDMDVNSPNYLDQQGIAEQLMAVYYDWADE